MKVMLASLVSLNLVSGLFNPSVDFYKHSDTCTDLKLNVKCLDASAFVEDVNEVLQTPVIDLIRR